MLDVFVAAQSAVLMFEGARRLAKASSPLLWLAAIGLSEQFISHKLNRIRYEKAANKLNVHATRLTLEYIQYTLFSYVHVL